MSLPVEPSTTLDAHSYHHHQGIPIIDAHHSDQLNWQPASSPLASPAWSPECCTPDKISTSSSVSAGLVPDTLNSHYPPNFNSQSLSELSIHEPLSDLSLPPHLHLSALEAPSTWTSTWPHSSNPDDYYAPTLGPVSLTRQKAYPMPIKSESPASTISFYGGSPVQSSYYSSPDLTHAGFANLSPPSLVQDDMDYDEDDDGQGGKPYARLIYEALLEAPGHRMMLRDLYDWFEKNTTKPRESGTNGWQNSIRHNLSMNHAFENDKTQTLNARGEPKKATSVWYLTDYALRNGVQSTTRYRKNGGTRRSALHGRPNSVRARSGAKGGLAARRAARFRQKEQSPYLTWASQLPIDHMDPFNNLVRAATSLKDATPTGRTSHPSPVEHQHHHYQQLPQPQQQHQSCIPSPASASADYQAKISPEIGLPLKIATAADVTFDEFKSQDLFLSEHLGTTLDDSWFQASQIG